MKSGNINFLEPSQPLQVCNGTALPFSVRGCVDSRAIELSDATQRAAKIVVYIQRNSLIMQPQGTEMFSVAGRFRLIEVLYVWNLRTVKIFH